MQRVYIYSIYVYIYIHLHIYVYNKYTIYNIFIDMVCHTLVLI